MAQKQPIARKIVKDGIVSVFIYALPAVLMFLYFYLTGQRPWNALPAKLHFGLLEPFFRNLTTWGLPALTLGVGIAEFSLGLYDRRWDRNERLLDITCFVVPKIIVRPAVVYFTLKLLPLALPGLKGVYAWVPFGWGFLIIA